MIRLETDLRGLPGAEALFAEFEGQKLQNRIRRGLRAGVAVIRRPLRSKAGSGGFPRKFKRTRTRGHRNPVGVSLSPGSPLSTIFERGARPHAIPITKGRFAGRTVQHPGMAARPISGPVFDSHQREAENAITDAIFEGIR